MIHFVHHQVQLISLLCIDDGTHEDGHAGCEEHREARLAETECYMNIEATNRAQASLPQAKSRTERHSGLKSILFTPWFSCLEKFVSWVVVCFLSAVSCAVLFVVEFCDP